MKIFLLSESGAHYGTRVKSPFTHQHLKIVQDPDLASSTAVKSCPVGDMASVTWLGTLRAPGPSQGMWPEFPCQVLPGRGNGLKSLLIAC